MNNDAPAAGTIGILPPQEARRIAAGEVVDKPAALIREFLDNAIDAKSSNIDVCIEEGGGKKVEVADDGSGMNYDDLKLCWLDHATSKIRSLDDLNTAETLGFRGEALAAAAAVARLEITSCAGGKEAWLLEVGPGEITPPRMTAVSRVRGTTVRALNLFDAIPARKSFLKRDGTEAASCRQIFIEKALAFPAITFSFTQDGRSRHFFPAVKSKKERFALALLDAPERNFLHEIHVMGNGFSADIVIGGPELAREQRRMLYVFANGRRIQDYSLLTAMEYGVQGLFPNGTHPVGAVFLQIDPALADFNIHPAKKEARFRDPGAIHHAITSGLRDFCRRLSIKSGPEAVAQTAPPQQAMSLAMEALEGAAAQNEGYHGVPASPREALVYNFEKVAQAAAAGIAAEAPPRYGEPRYVGNVFGFFMVVEWDSRIYLIDQHAAHERILYNRFLSNPIPRQELLIPIPFTTESAQDDAFLEAKREELERLAIVIENDGGSWRIDALPQSWRLGDAETVQAILELRTANENIAERWAATLCCHQALRDGDIIDEEAALELAKEALALPDPRCPHGRPIWTEITRDALYKAVKRA